MRTIFLVGLLLLFTTINPLISQECQDQNPITVTTVCGTVLDICMDNYVLEPGQQMIVMDVYSNDLQLFDACASHIIVSEDNPSQGIVRRISQLPVDYAGQTWYPPEGVDPCLHVYIAATPDGLINDFYEYEVIVNEECISVPDYCTSGSSSTGKIWTINSQYLGDNPVEKVLVYDTKNLSTPFDSAHNLSKYDYFVIDGTSLPNNQTNWLYRFYYIGGGTAEVTIHTSCSVQIFGETYPSAGNPLVMPVSGCVSPSNGGQIPGPRDPCGTPTSGPPNGENGEVYYSFQSSDITTVTVIRETVLPLELLDFYVLDMAEANMVQWTVGSAKDEFEMTLEKSYDGAYFFPIKAFANITLETYTFYDKDIKRKDHYYRIKSTSINGDIAYSDVKYIEREIESEITFFPNPTNSRIQLNLYSNQLDRISQVAIYDLAGRRIFQQNIQEVSKNLDLKEAGLTAGIYLLEANSESGLQKIEKLIIQ